MSHSVALWISVALLLGNAFFVGAEFSAMAARRSTLEPLAEAGSARARICLTALEQMGSLLATAQLGITVCSVGLGALAEVALHEILEGLFDGWDVQGRFGLSDAWTSPIVFDRGVAVLRQNDQVVGHVATELSTTRGHYLEWEGDDGPGPGAPGTAAVRSDL